MPINKSLLYASKTGIFADAPYHAAYEPYPSFGDFGRTAFTYATDPAFGNIRDLAAAALTAEGIESAKTGEAAPLSEGGSKVGTWIVVGAVALALGIFGMTLLQGKRG